MPRKRRKKPVLPVAVIAPKEKRFSFVPMLVFLSALCVIGGVFFYLAPTKNEPIAKYTVNKPVTSHSVASPFELVKYSRKTNRMQELLAMTPEQLRQVDIAEMNLLCAVGLPGAERIDIDKCLAQLDQWAAKVKFETDRHLYRVHDPRWAAHYRHSESYFRAEMLLQVLQEDCGVKYNPQRIFDVDFTNSKDLFIHGMIDDPNGGTCASMPVLYVAVGRRLGYPLFLSHTKGHLFARWEDAKDRFNIEGSGEGFASHPDEYYHNWPFTLTEAEKNGGYFLSTKTPAQDFAGFLATRAHCLQDIGCLDDAESTYELAHSRDPQNPFYAQMGLQVFVTRQQRSRPQRMVNQPVRKPIDLYEHVPPGLRPPKPFTPPSSFTSPYSPIQPIQPFNPNINLPQGSLMLIE
jgi:hypothetical protein